MRVGIDLDGVMYPWQEEVWEYMKQGTPQMPDNYTWFWTVHNRIKFFGYDPLEFVLDIEFLYVSGKILDPATKTILLALINNHDVFYVTARPESTSGVTDFWLKKNGYWSGNEVIFSARKAHISQELKLDYFIEDRISNLEELLETKTKPLGIKQVWNTNLWKGNNIPMFMTLYGAIQYILK